MWGLLSYSLLPGVWDLLIWLADMLIITFQNDGKGSNEDASYEVVVKVGFRTIYRGRLTGHNRDNGWPALLAMFAEKARAEISTIQIPYDEE